MTLRYLTPLSPEEQRDFGLPEPQPLAIADRVRFAELDNQDHVNNKAYMEWFETLRVAYTRTFVEPLCAGSGRPRFMLHSATVRYLQEIREGESYVTTCRVAAFRSSSFTMEQMIWAGTLRATLHAVMALRHADGARKYPLPPALIRHFAEADGARREG